MPAPEDIGPGATPHDPDCHACVHRWHLLPCDTDGCPCTDHTRPGLD